MRIRDRIFLFFLMNAIITELEKKFKKCFIYDFPYSYQASVHE